MKHHGVSKKEYRRIAGEELETSFGRKIDVEGGNFGALRLWNSSVDRRSRYDLSGIRRSRSLE
jgi:hypothetical protein